MGRPEKELDPTAGQVPRFAHELRELRREAGGLSYREMARRAGYSVTALSQAAAGERLPTLPVALAYAVACGGDPEEWERRWRAAEAEHLAELASGTDDGSDPPYRGLARFEPEDEAVFFGRGQLTDELTDLVAAHRFSVVFGPSGSGKSSLLRAGLIPRLRRSRAPLPRAAALRVLTPGEHPMRTHGRLLVPAGGEGETWLVVDQFEEVFTLCADPRERDAFLTALLAARRADSRLRVVLGVRADFHPRCLAHPGLAAAFREAALPVGPLTAAELRGAIVKPAAACGLIVERALTARLVEEVADEPGSLPLLSHALLETWRRRRGRTLTLEGYRAASGLHGALAQTAEDLYADLTPAQAEAARRILLSLITPGEGAPDTRRPVSRSEVVPAGAESDAHAVLDRLARARLVTLDQDTVDLAHEALITAWPRLRDWIDEGRERLRRHRRLTQATHNWLARQRDGGALLRGGELAEAELAFASARDQRELTRAEREFLRASTAARTRARWTRRTVTSAVALLVVLVTVAGAAAWQQGRDSRQQREESRQQREEAAARRVASLAQGVRASDPVLAMRLSLAAWTLKQTTETRSALLGAFAQPEADTYDVPDGDNPTTTSDAVPVRLSADGRTVVTTGESGVRAWDVTTRRAVGPPVPTSYDRRVTGISPDGRTALLSRTQGEGPDVQRWDLASGEPVDDPRRTNGSVDGYAPDGRTVVETWLGGNGRGRLGLRDARGGRLLIERPTGLDPRWAVSPDGRLLALCARGAGGSAGKEAAALEVWDVAQRRRLPATWSGACAAESFAFTGDGGTLMARSPDGLRLWDPVAGRERTPVRHPGLTDATASPDGRFAVAADNREVLLWRLASPGEPVFRFPLANEAATQLRIDTAAGVIRYVTERHRSDTVVRTVSYGPAMAADWNPEPASKGAFSRDGLTLAVDRRRGGTSYFEAYRVPNGRRLARTPAVPCSEGSPPLGDDECYTLLALSPDGRTLVHGRTSLFGDDERKDYRQLVLWDVRADAPARPLADPHPPYSARLPMTGLAFTPDGRSLLVTRYGMDTVDIWDLSRRQRTRPADQSRSHFTVLDFSPRPSTPLVRPDGRLVATPRHTFALPTGRVTSRGLHMDATGVLAFSPDGAHLAVGDGAGGVTLWDGDVTRRRGALLGAQNAARRGTVEAVKALAFSPDGTTLAVAGDGGTLQLWDVASGQPLGSPLPTPGDGIVAVAFSPDGRTVHSAGEHSGIRSHPVAPESLTASVCGRAGGGLSPDDWETYLPGVPYRKVC
ncbi:helix-turn-helix domain-containing protein [Streptomyces sp. TRM76323]|uniref:Helix-turn-helix domain-containing protein n=1 Tax=Streptomyces tamarix TaxID=3078565 RepID=A0ABU3QDW8_9ACTN|nr:helix-turn-helix domain-containing protein [Streptomyces tamarix]MDT9680978.1 helix-turn-helix domain-containing protein [Streptomyces tamarix]